MSQQVIDTENIVQSLSVAPDKLRARIGKYYSVRLTPVSPQIGRRLPSIPKIQTTNFGDGKIRSAEISESNINNQVLIPFKTSTITIIGEEHAFRDYIQWEDFVNQTIQTDEQFLDHTFGMNLPIVSNSFIKNYHNPNYEDLTKTTPSNQLLNFNLLSYSHKNKIPTIRNIAEIRTPYDNDTIAPSIDTLMKQFSNRILNYTGSNQEISAKQQNIFILDRGYSTSLVNEFPVYYKKSFNIKPRPYFFSDNFISILSRNKKEKNLFQMIKRDLSFSNRSFTIDGDQVVGKIYNAISLLTSTSLKNFSESSNELFLLEEKDIGQSRSSERFVNQIDTIKFLSEMRVLIENNSRNIDEIFNNENCQSFLLGYKIEKYLDNDATLPIQTYYINDLKFHDTQIKYNRRYIYKTKALVAILGNSYSYKNLRLAEEEFQPDSPTSEKYWAKVDVSVAPSFQILEYQIDSDEVVFRDIPAPEPHVSIYGKKNSPKIHFFLQPRLTTASSQDFSLDYFTGTYEVYRLDFPPNSTGDMVDGFLRTVDETVVTGNFKKTIPTKKVSILHARFEDEIVPNRKYYYAFSTRTYHGTVSELTNPIEVELQQDSDEYKIITKPYEYPEEKDYSLEKKAKRLISIAPNIERLLFSKEEDINNWDLDSGNLVSKAAGGHKTFKIRITSKHTGKKMDLNITFKLKQDDSFNNEIN